MTPFLKKMRILTLLFGFGIAIILLVHYYSIDGIEGVWFNILFEEDTIYSSTYSNTAFRQIKRGMSRQQVERLLGTPLVECWIYKGIRDVWIYFRDGVVSDIIDKSQDAFARSIEKGMKREDVFKNLGEPVEKSLIYSQSPGDKSYRVRVIILKNNAVTEKIHELYVD